MRKTYTAGFTLIEMMIVLAIVGILAAIAYPSYLNHVRHSYRAEAQSTLVAIAQAQEKYYTLNNRYSADLTSLGYASTTISTTSNRYSITMGNLDASSTLANGLGYSLTATPGSGGQSSDSCGNVTLDSLGRKGVTGSGATVAGCWQ